MTTEKGLIPKNFILLDNFEEMKQAITQDMEGNNLSVLLSSTQKRKDRDEISNMIDNFDEESKANPQQELSVDLSGIDMAKRTLPGLDNLMPSGSEIPAHS